MNETKLTIREKLVIVLTIFLIKMIKPWQYDHQFENVWTDIKRTINGEDFVTVKKDKL